MNRFLFRNIIVGLAVVLETVSAVLFAMGELFTRDFVRMSIITSLIVVAMVLSNQKERKEQKEGGISVGHSKGMFKYRSIIIVLAVCLEMASIILFVMEKSSLRSVIGMSITTSLIIIAMLLSNQEERKQQEKYR